MEYKTFVEAMETQRPITISSEAIQWIEKERVIRGSFEGFTVEMPTEEIGISEKHITRKIPPEVSKLLSEELKVLVTAKREDNTFLISRKAYVKQCMKGVEVGQIYDAEIVSVCSWGAFFKINGDAPVLVHISHMSKCRIGDMRKVYGVGYRCKIKIIKKEETEEGIRLSGSRINVHEESVYKCGNTVRVLISDRINSEGFFCEIDSGTVGIVNVPAEQQDMLQTGMRVYAEIKARTLKGYKCKFLSIEKPEKAVV